MMKALTLRMTLTITIILVILTSTTAAVAAASSKQQQLKDQHDFCIMGGGPGGIQLGYFLDRYGLDYVILERNSRPGSFFEKYPRQRNLISINKVYTGTNDTEFNLRHDWNSLLNGDDDFFFPPKPSKNSDDADDDNDDEKNQAKPEPAFLFKEVSEEYYPSADDIPIYLEKFLEKHPLNIVFDVEVDRILRARSTDQKKKQLHNKKKKAAASLEEEEDMPATGDFHLFLSTGSAVRCRSVIVATGKAVEKKSKLRQGDHLTTSYTDAPTDPEEYNDQDILIIGAGNGAMELARMMESNAALVHIASRNPIQLAHHTHYVGDVRAVNLGFLDRYQLKSNDALIGTPSNDVGNERLELDEATGRIKLLPAYIDPELLGQIQGTPQHLGAPSQQQQQHGGDGGGGGGSQAVAGQQQQQPPEPKKPVEQVEAERIQQEAQNEIHPSRRGYHRVIVCTGFTWNSTPFFESTSTKRTQKAVIAAKRKETLSAVSPTVEPTGTYLEVASNFESVNVPDLFVAGALAHFRDHKRSAGGFIHGFRYTARTLATMLRERYSSRSGSTAVRAKNAYPFIAFRTREQVLHRFLFRLHNVSSLYQMQSHLCDAVVINVDDEYTPFRYYQDLPLDMVKSKMPELVSIDAFKPESLHFLTLSLEFGKDFQGVGTLHHHSQKETYRRRAEKLLWDPAIPTSDPDVRLFIAQRFNPGRPLPLQEKITSQNLIARDEKSLSQYEGMSVDISNLLQPLEEPPTMTPPKDGRPPRLSRFLFLHPVVREWKRSPPNNKGGAGGLPMVKNQLIREVRLHEDVLNDFTGFYYAESPMRNFLNRVMDAAKKNKKSQQKSKWQAS